MQEMYYEILLVQKVLSCVGWSYETISFKTCAKFEKKFFKICAEEFREKSFETYKIKNLKIEFTEALEANSKMCPMKLMKGTDSKWNLSKLVQPN